eukprot:TRINITY_DN10186_c0_g1_i1.p2 TRINITY_DN10186_c0_g1~~TRINITY_DN10186_c0_g1_i1.p2  ORF type:complete len:54 (-),score=1.59 TRINITY_DN10186_c0_g1_i1:179-340(-)
MSAFIVLFSLSRGRTEQQITKFKAILNFHEYNSSTGTRHKKRNRQVRRTKRVH